MIRDRVTRVSLESFRQKAHGKKIVLLYPWTNYRTLFLSHFLQNSQGGLLYYRLDTDNMALSKWLSALAEELNDVTGNFGAHLRAALADPKAQALGEALAADLNAFPAEQVTLFIDELDRTPLTDDLRTFAHALVANLTDKAQVALNSRLLTYEPWYKMVAHGDAVVLGTEYRKDDVAFTIEPNPRPQLEVYALGRGYALVNGQQITNWDGALPRNLFFYFMDRPLVTRDEIFATFWPDLNVKEATNVFHVTKRKISERISMKVDDDHNYELTQYSGGFYMPSEKVVRHYDVYDFHANIERAMMTGNEREEEELLIQAIDLYKAPFLQTVNMAWTEERRDQLRQLYAQALISMGRMFKRRSDLPRALGFFVRALRETPEREDIHREVMSLYVKLDQIDDARMQYQALERILRETLNISPSRESRELFELIGSR